MLLLKNDNERRVDKLSRYLIVNADDFGMCRSANEAVFELFRSGKLHSSTIMDVCPAAEEAMRFAVEHPEYAIGVHLTMTSEWKTYRWKPLTGGASLVDEEGYMWHSTEQVEKNAKLSDLKAELNAQIDKALAFGMKPSHIDNHMGSLYGNRTLRFTMLNMTLKEMGRRGYAFRLYAKADKRLTPAGTPEKIYMLSGLLTGFLAKIHKVILPDYLLFPDWNRELSTGGYDNYRKTILDLWTNIPEGVTETFLHPCKETDELKEITPNWFQRVWEYELMKDPATHEYLKEHGVTMISYRELIAMKKKG